MMAAVLVWITFCAAYLGQAIFRESGVWTRIKLDFATIMKNLKKILLCAAALAFLSLATPAFASAHGPYTRKQAVAECKLNRGETSSIGECVNRLMGIRPPRGEEAPVTCKKSECGD